MDAQSSATLLLPQSVEDALAALNDHAAPLAGGTWIMRAPIRGEKSGKSLISLSHIEALRRIELSDESLRIGAMATHEALAKAIGDQPDLGALKTAAAKSANPAIRRQATIGGNICTTGFAASDLVPALIACDAVVETQSATGTNSAPIEALLAELTQSATPHIVTHITVPRSAARSTHIRMLMRKAGEYPVANLSMSLTFDDHRKIATARIAVGAVEDQAKRWSGLESALIGQSADIDISALATQHISQFTGRDAADAPGWYRTRILPKLAAEAFAQLTSA